MALETHLSWREPYASVSLNRKNSGIIPPGVYRGFVVSAGGGMVLNIAPNVGDYPRSVAVVDRDGFNFTVSSDDTETFTVPDGTSGTLYLCLQSQYIEGGGGANTFVLIASASIQPYHIVLAQLVIPGATTEITSGMISTTGRSLPKGTQFDASELLASRSFVQRALGSMSGYYGTNVASLNLDASHFGKLVNFSGSGAANFYLPLASAGVQGAKINFFNAGTANVTVNRSGSDNVFVNGGTVTAITLGPGDWLEAVVSNNESTGTWILSGGSVKLGSSRTFLSSIGTSGYQRLPSGMIIQWGDFQAGTGGTSVNYPTTWPNGRLAITLTHKQTAGGAVVSMAASEGTTSSFSVTASQNASYGYFIAIGY